MDNLERHFKLPGERRVITVVESLMKRSLWAVVLGIACSPVVTTAETGLNNEGDPIAFVAALEGRYPAFDEAFFSVPRPIVVINPVVFGNPDKYPSHTTIQQVGPAEIRVRIRGRVFDFLADMVADNLADIEQVRIYSHASGMIATVPLQLAEGEVGHPFGKSFDDSPAADAVRPYPFTGQFDFGEFTLPINTGYNGISVEALNLNNTAGTATLDITATIDRQKGSYDVTAEVSEYIDAGLYNPILVYINDPEVTTKNYGEKHALINGHKVGLRFIDGQLQLDRPIIGINHSPPMPIPNVVNVVGDPNGFLIQYGEHKSEFSWSYTAMTRPAARPLLRKSTVGLRP